MDGQEVLLGTRRLMADNSIDVKPIEASISSLEDMGKTAMLMAINGSLQAILAVADTVKESSREAIQDLQDMWALRFT